MKATYFILLGVMLLTFYPAAAVVAPLPPPPVSQVSQPPNINSMMSPAAQNLLNTALQLKDEAQSLLDQATEKQLDVATITDSLAEADALVENAQKIAMCNPIPAGNMLRQAIEIYNKAVSDLKSLLA